MSDDVKEANRDIEERNKNWYEIIGKTLETLKDPKERFDEATTSGEKRSILQSIGPVATLVEVASEDEDTKRF
ncbi:MAG: hypothetical protein ACK5MU_00580 [Candidatus Saccharimonadales bacterium]